LSLCGKSSPMELISKGLPHLPFIWC